MASPGLTITQPAPSRRCSRSRARSLTAWDVKRVFGIHLDQFDFIDTSGQTIPADQIGKQAGKKIPFKMEVSQIREIREYLRKRHR
jgi:hypothetical protein